MLVMDPAQLDITPSKPQVLHTEDSGRTIGLALAAGQALREHQTRERAYLVVASGRVAVELPDGSHQRLGPGGSAIFEPGERREVLAEEDSQIVLLLTPWPAPRPADSPLSAAAGA